MRIAVLGDGLAAHLAAAMLARAGAGEVVRVPVGNGDHGLGPVGHAVLGLPEWQASDIAEAIGWVPGSAFALGIALAGWGKGNAFLPFGDTGASLDGLPFAQVAARLRADGQQVDFADFSLAAMAARAERFATPATDPRSPLATLGLGVSYPADALAERLAALAQEAGVRVAEAMPSADLHVDASGGARTSGAWESWQAWLPCNRVASRIVPSDRPPPPYPLHGAGPDGWRAHVALDGMLADAAYSVEGPGIPYRNGLRREAWTGNRVAVGAVAGVVEPVLGTALLLLHDAVARLIALLPYDLADTRAEAGEYNRLTASQHERARDAAVALWAVNARMGEPLWDAARDRAPPALANKLALYRSRGAMPMYDDEPLSRADWIALLDGLSVRQRRLDPLAAALSADVARAHCARVRDRLAATLPQMPRHADALARLRSAR